MSNYFVEVWVPITDEISIETKYSLDNGTFSPLPSCRPKANNIFSFGDCPASRTLGTHTIAFRFDWTDPKTSKEKMITLTGRYKVVIEAATAGVDDDLPETVVERHSESSELFDARYPAGIIALTICGIGLMCFIVGVAIVVRTRCRTQGQTIEIH
jgi:hypothetical protein